VTAHTSNADRIARAAAEADAAKKELDKKKATRAAAGTARKPRAPKAPPRMKIIWGVGVPGLEPVKTFPYKERPAADAEAEKRGKGCMVRPLKVPMV
jgi:hypothetical protein